jgi:glycosyltransferase involved in cell wall biosynthesis
MSARVYHPLFVTHNTGYYGAARSLQTLLRHYPTAQAELLVTKWLTHRNDLAEIKTRFGPYVSRVWEAHLPFDRCFKGKPPATLRSRVRDSLWRWTRNKLLAEIARHQVDFVYLNSLVLHPLADERMPFIVHVREIYDGTRPEVFESLAKAAGVIFIDEATRAPFGARLAVPDVVLNNPFDLGEFDDAAVRRVRDRHGLVGKTVFAIVGSMNENKGTAFVIECFKRAQRHDAGLLIVGAGEQDYEAHCRQLAAGLDGVVFHGFEREISAIYGACDYVIRAEAYPCIGRTIYEGLYAGCGVIVPGSRDDAARMFDFARFQDRVFSYPPRNAEALTALFRTLPPYSTRPARAASNVDEFVARFDRFVSSSLVTRRELRSRATSPR